MPVPPENLVRGSIVQVWYWNTAFISMVFSAVQDYELLMADSGCLCPQVSVEAAVLDGFGDVLGAEVGAVFPGFLRPKRHRTFLRPNSSPK